MRFMEIGLDKTNSEQLNMLKKLSLLLNKSYYDTQTGTTGRIVELGMRPDIENGRLLVYYRTFSDIEYGMCFAKDFIAGDLKFIKPNKNTEIIDGTAEKQLQEIKSFFGDEFREDMIVEISPDTLFESFKKRISYSTPTIEWENAIGAMKEAAEEYIK